MTLTSVLSGALQYFEKKIKYESKKGKWWEFGLSWRIGGL